MDVNDTPVELVLLHSVEQGLVRSKEEKIWKSVFPQSEETGRKYNHYKAPPNLPLHVMYIGKYIYLVFVSIFWHRALKTLGIS